ncbi:Uma2 family endonuclease [Aneurinibacillus aneurinilyticus]|uniref:Uma2 family endonuclease n=1 Tax=Aneurinibacillus aneurinilyticus TaxID=1391 RepID=UPI0023F33625|nr:Uma2 family endonuclease [Aneurinibacillus aneurinilyticus]
MSLAQERFVSIEEFYVMREKTDNLLEYVDGVIFMSPSPSTKHQRISSRLHARLFNFLDQKKSGCEVFHAPFDVELQKEGVDGKKIVIPDLSIICDKNGFMENKYIGVPAIIIEILSPSNQSHDLVFKLNLYMQYGVKEYWIINPMLNAIQLYVLDESMQYQQMDVIREQGIIKSHVLQGFQVQLEELF